MAKIISFCCAVCLLASVIVNVFFLTNVIWKKGKWWNQLSWSPPAAAEAEAVAAVPCSGHGRAYLDGVVVSGAPVCECNTCFRGADCSEFIPDCAADADSGDPLFLEPFWMQNAADSALLVSGWHRMSYSFPDKTYISEELVNEILKLHAISKNAVTDGRYILFGSGSTNLLIAAVYALSQGNSSFPAKVVGDSPFYRLYKSQTEYFENANFEFVGDVSLVMNDTDNVNVIEFVTSPNNPDGYLKKAVLHGPTVKQINDYAYYWPHFTGIPAPADDDLMIFTISKLSGHAGSRFGWAIVKDKDVYDKMQQFVSMSQMGISRDTQLRALKLLKVITKDNGKQIFEFGSKNMTNRWVSLNKIISKSNRFSLQKIPPEYCTYFNKVRDASPAFGWLKCEREEERDCSAVLRAANIIGRPGNVFSVEDRFVRLSLLKHEDDFEILLYRLEQLIESEENAQVI